MVNSDQKMRGVTPFAVTLCEIVINAKNSKAFMSGSNPAGDSKTIEYINTTNVLVVPIDKSLS
jgi:hypothetical protein